MKVIFIIITSILMSIIWFILMSIRIIAFTIWDFNPKRYKFKYCPYNEKDNVPVSSWFVDDYDRTNYQSFFHYIWNIKPRNYEN